MKLIIGLGNPGKAYAFTRHNIGWRILDALVAQQKNLNFVKNDRHESFIAEISAEGQKLIFAKPLTFMNLSGKSVASLVRFYKLHPSQDLLIISDDKDMLFSKLRLRSEGSSGGHKGIQSIIEHLGTNQFHRLKCGIGHADQKLPTDAFVLEKFTPEEKIQIPKLIEKSLMVIQEWLSR